MIGGLLIATNFLEGLSDKLGVRPTLVIGYGLLAVGLAMGATTDVGTAYGFIAVWMAVVGLGVGLVLPTSMALAVGALTPERAGAGSALLSALRQASGTIGVAVLGTVVSMRYHSALGPLNHEPISAGVGSGVAVAHSIGDNVMLAEVQSAFMSGMSLLMWVCAGICLAAIAMVGLSGRQSTETTRAPAEPESAQVG